MDKLDIGKKGVSVTILGLENAGKTTLVQRLKTNAFVTDTVPTPSLNIEIVKYNDILLKIFDLAGHPQQRNSLWLNYSSYSYGIIFVLDSNDRDRLLEAKEWFWYLIDNIAIEKQITIMFLANKADLDCMSLDEIIETLELNKISKFPKASFQIFKTSNMTGKNIEYAMDWFTKKLKEISDIKRATPKALMISTIVGKVLSFLDFSEISEKKTDISRFLSLIFRTAKSFLKNQHISMISTEEVKFVIQEEEGILISLIIDPDDSHVEAQRYLDLIHSHFKHNPEEQKKEFHEFLFQLFEISEDDREYVKEIDVTLHDQQVESLTTSVSD